MNRNQKGIMKPITIKQIERALNLANEMFENDNSWHELPDESKLRFAYALIVGFRESEKSHNVK